MAHKYTEEQADFIKNNIKGIKSNDLTKMFNNKFGLSLKVTQIRAFIKNHNLKSGLDCRFKVGAIPFNKGKKGLGGWKPTEFRKGHLPHNYIPVGSERIDGDGYTQIKIADPNKWKGKHILIWEKHNGPVPKGYAVIFGDGNKNNLELDNLILVSRQQLLILNRNKLIQKDVNLTRTAVIIANVYQKMYERKAK